MKSLYNKNCQLKRYLEYQAAIQKLEEYEPLSLIIIKKANGYEDVFVLNKNGETIGEFFPDESHDLFNFVKYPEHFFIKCNVRKFIEKENNLKSVVVDISVEAKEDFDYSAFIANIENAAETESVKIADRVEDNNSSAVVEPDKKKGSGCVKWMLIIGFGFIFLMFLLGWITSKQAGL